jgi:uncharacterized protein (TIGR02611 family)
LYDQSVVARIRRLFKIVAGFTVLAAGVAMLVLPGPGWVVIAVALAILAGEFVWAKTLLDHLKETGTKINNAVNPMKRRSDQS